MLTRFSSDLQVWYPTFFKLPHWKKIWVEATLKQSQASPYKTLGRFYRVLFKSPLRVQIKHSIVVFLWVNKYPWFRNFLSLGYVPDMVCDIGKAAKPAGSCKSSPQPAGSQVLVWVSDPITWVGPASDRTWFTAALLKSWINMIQALLKSKKDWSDCLSIKHHVAISNVDLIPSKYARSCINLTTHLLAHTGRRYTQVLWQKTGILYQNIRHKFSIFDPNLSQTAELRYKSKFSFLASPLSENTGASVTEPYTYLNYYFDFAVCGFRLRLGPSASASANFLMVAHIKKC